MNKYLLKLTLLPYLCAKASLSLPMRAECEYIHLDSDGYQQKLKGHALINKKGQFKLEVKNQLSMIDDGKYLWINDIPLKQVTRLEHFPMFDLIKKIKDKNLKKTYKVHSKIIKGAMEYEFIPKNKNSEVKKFGLKICSKKQLCQLFYLDNFNERHEYNFINRTFSKIDSKEFIYHHKKGVDIIYPHDL